MSSLYLHVPFCRRKCPYCDFFSVSEHPALLDAYPDLLLKHLELLACDPRWERCAPLETVFLGGGTPSLLPPAAVGRILESAERLFGFAPDAEISLEANPGTVTPVSLAGYRSSGVNRLSLGIQSLQDERLKLLGRLHSSAEAAAALRQAREAGFENLACDLMFALPGQSPAELAGEIDRLLDLGAVHLSCYGLTVEEGTPFAHRHRAGDLPLPDEESYAEQFLGIHDHLQRCGFEHYEISNYALPGRECRHNLRYWRRRPCMAAGAGAHSFCAGGWGERREVPQDLARYQQKLDKGEDPSRELEIYDREGAMAETLYLALRTARGVSEAAFRRRFGLGVEEAFPEALRRTGPRLRPVEGFWRFDAEGWLLYDHLISAFL